MSVLLLLALNFSGFAALCLAMDKHQLELRGRLLGTARSRQGAPVRTIHSTPSTNMRLSRPVEPH